VHGCGGVLLWHCMQCELTSSCITLLRQYMQAAVVAKQLHSRTEGLAGSVSRPLSAGAIQRPPPAHVACCCANTRYSSRKSS
jgi:hypothetical protein